MDKRMIWNEVKDYIFITMGLVMYATAWCMFLLPYEIVSGGVTGLSAIILYATGFPLQNSYFIFNAILLVVALKVLGWKFLIKTIYATFMLSFFLWLGQEIMPTGADGHPVKILGEGQDFMSLIIGCTFIGSSLAIVFLNNGSTGGTDIIAAVVNKYFNMSLGRVLIVVDLLIIGSCLFIPQFGDGVQRMHKVVFGLCTMVIDNFMLDYVMNARRESVQFFIFSRKYKEIAEVVATEIGHGVTLLNGQGWYTGQDLKVLCVLAKKRESTSIFRIVKMIDPSAFVSQSSVIGVYGEGFDTIKVRLKKQEEGMKV
ncbi:MAG: YitT family protein [Prevotella sp.]|nr:YitT family protein [Prevotella sp.]MDY6130827.1 YitT family protein [Prevotella sp.]